MPPISPLFLLRLKTQDGERTNNQICWGKKAQCFVSESHRPWPSEWRAVNLDMPCQELLPYAPKPNMHFPLQGFYWIMGRNYEEIGHEIAKWKEESDCFASIATSTTVSEANAEWTKHFASRKRCAVSGIKEFRRMQSRGGRGDLPLVNIF